MAYNILVADDDVISRKVMSSVLANDNNAVYSVLEACNATEALDVVGRGHIDLVLLDWQMPDMSGLEAMKLIKRMDRMIPVIIVTGLIDSKDLSYALDMGANDYIKKPIDKAEFRARIRCALMLRDSIALKAEGGMPSGETFAEKSSGIRPRSSRKPDQSPPCFTFRCSFLFTHCP